MEARALGRPRLLATEVIQTSGMDCGPAALKALLDGFRIPVSYGRLREACHTDIDGTSIDTLEDVARRIGLDAQQIMLPLDHVLLAETRAFPAIAVVRSASGSTHFVLAWRRHGPLVQIMDPARGRMWVSAAAFLKQLVVHPIKVAAKDWRAFASTSDFIGPLRMRLRRTGVSRSSVDAYVTSALADDSWRGLATLDAATRMTAALQGAGALDRAQGRAALDALLSTGDAGIPAQYWFVRPARDGSADDLLTMRGAVLVSVRSRDRIAVPETTGTVHSARLSPELSAALDERPLRPLRDLGRLLDRQGWTTAMLLGVVSLLAACGVIVEATLLRSALDIGGLLRGPEQGLFAAAALVAFAAAMVALEGVLSASERRLGRRLEHRMRVAFLEKIPRLADAYFQSRPISDMLERGHTLHTLRVLPRMGVRCARVACELTLTALALAWLSPGTAAIAAAAAVTAAAIPLIGHSLLAERDLRARTHAGALARFHLDALLGRTAIEAHGAEDAIEREHEALLSEWAATTLSSQRASVAIEGLQMLVGFGLTAWMVLGHITSSNASGLLLQMYWMLSLPALGYELALIAREYPSHRTTILRLLEPLGAPDAILESAPNRLMTPPMGESTRAGVAIEAHRVSIVVGGQRILEDVDWHVPAGTHVAIVGSSGAGKSTLAGLLLGWHRPASGELLIDGEPLTPDGLESLRRVTAWVDPTVQIWNRPLIDNILYGSDGSAHLSSALEMAGLLPVIAKLPQGLATPLGEGGARLSAGEAQRVRLGRAMVHPRPRLVILDEPFVGLERDRRRALLTQSRQHWSASTLLYVTHDVAETRAFDRVLVIDRGRVIEDGNPLHLAQLPSSRYRRLLQAQDAAHSRFAASPEWRHIRLESGRIVHDHVNASEQTA